MTQENNLLICGDFNARTGREGGAIIGENSDRYIRQSKDNTVNKAGKVLLQELSKNRLMILNEYDEVHESGEWTYVGEQGCSVIDYSIVNSEACDKIISFKVIDRCESDHVPLLVEIESNELIGNLHEKEIRVKKTDWKEKGLKHYEQKIKEYNSKKVDKYDIWQELKEIIDD